MIVIIAITMYEASATLKCGISHTFMLTPILQTRTLRLCKFKPFFQEDTANIQLSRDSNLVYLILVSGSLPFNGLPQASQEVGN